MLSKSIYGVGCKCYLGRELSFPYVSVLKR
jgi:hypothetical protein